MLYRLHNELKLPVYCLLDNDPWGYYIYSVIKQGSINLAYESQADGDPRRAVPRPADHRLRALRALAERADQAQRQDIKRAKQIAAYPWFANKKPWQKEIDQMLKNGFKLEVESLISKDISYVTEKYVPERLEEKHWLD